MAYITPVELNQYGVSSAALTGVDSASIDAALEAATDEAETILRDRGYEIPIVNPSPKLKRAVAAIAAWDLVAGIRGVNPEDPSHAALAKMRDDNVDWLRKIAKGGSNLSQTRTATGVATVISNKEPRGL